MPKFFRLMLGLVMCLTSLVAVSATAAVAGSAATPAAARTTLTVPLAQLNASGITGTAKLSEANGKTTVVVDVTGAPSGVAMPSHIHEGTCANLNPLPKYPLIDIVDGHSETVVDTTISALLASQFAINVHKSATDIKVYVACGDLVAPGSDATPAAATGATTVAIQIVDFSFAPVSMTVSAGSTVTFTNTGVDHTASTKDAPVAFDSGILHTGQSFSVVLKTPGTYHYICLLHPTMVGTIIVTWSVISGFWPRTGIAWVHLGRDVTTPQKRCLGGGVVCV